MQHARGLGLAPLALSAHAIRHDAGQGLLTGFTNTKPEHAAALASRLKRALG